MRVKNAPKRWKDMVQVSGDVTSLKRSGGRLRKVTKHSPEEQVLEKLTEDDPYASTEILACRLLNKSGTNISSRAVCWQLYSRADERFSYKTPIKTTWSESLTCRMGYLEGMHNAIDQSQCCPQEFYFADECPIFFGVLPWKGHCRKGKQLYGRVPYCLKKYTFFILQQNQEATTKFGFQKTIPMMPKSRTLCSTIFHLQHMHQTLAVLHCLW